MTDIHVSAPGKVILCGEHAVVYGKRAIAAAVDIRTHVHSRKNVVAEFTLEMRALQLSISYSTDKWEALRKEYDSQEISSPSQQQIDFVMKLTSSHFNDSAPKLAAMSFFHLFFMISSGKPIPPCVVEVATELPLSSGLGSSASYAVALSSCLLILFDHITEVSSEESRNLINKCAYLAETIHHATPSGIDNAVTTHGSLIRYANKRIDTVKTSVNLKLFLVNTKIPRNTKQLVTGVREKIHQFPSIFSPICDAIGEVSIAFDDLLQQDQLDYQKISLLIDTNHSLLCSLGVSHPLLDSIVAKAHSFGIPMKLTGAGGGGFALGVLNHDVTPSAISEFKEWLLKNSFDAFETMICDSGVKLH